MYKVPEGFEADFDAILNPNNIGHEDAKAGSELIIKNCSAEYKYCIFRKLCVKSESPTEVAQKLFEEIDTFNKDSKHLVIAALRRFIFKSARLCEKYVKTQAKQESQDIETYDLLFGPGVSLDQHLKDANLAPKEYDCIQKMAGVTLLLERQFKAAYAYPARRNLPFFEASKVNMLAQTYMNALGQLHKMQIDVGLVTKEPDKMEINLSNVDAFQTYVGELTQQDKKTMIDFADTFCEVVKDKLKAKTSNEQRDT